MLWDSHPERRDTGTPRQEAAFVHASTGSVHSLPKAKAQAQRDVTLCTLPSFSFTFWPLCLRRVTHILFAWPVISRVQWILIMPCCLLFVLRGPCHTTRSCLIRLSIDAPCYCLGVLNNFSKAREFDIRGW